MKKLTYRQRAILCTIGGFMLMTGGGFSASLSLFLIPVTTEYGFPQASFSTYLALMSWFGIISHPFLGRLFARFARYIRVITLIAAFYGFLCFFLLSRSSDLPHFYIAGAMLSMMLPVVGPSLGVTVISWWFTKGRSIAISCAAVGASIGSVFYSKVSGYVIEGYGWRAGYLICAVLIFAATALGALLIAPPPEYTGIKPDPGMENIPSGADAPKPADAVLPLRELIKNPTFRLICLVRRAPYLFLRKHYGGRYRCCSDRRRQHACHGPSTVHRFGSLRRAQLFSSKRICQYLFHDRRRDRTHCRR